jgi:CheY-like chemotaxis protein/chemotaxis signal transduction protein
VSSPVLLLVDDSQAILAFEEAVLGAHYTIVKATGGVEGLRLAREVNPAAMLLDLSMPEVDGEQVLTEMKADPKLRAIPVIVVSNEHSRADACIRQGAADFVPKPIRKETLQGVVERVLAQSRATAGAGDVGVLFLEAGGVLVAVKLAIVRAVALQPETVSIETGYRFFGQMFHFRGAPVAVLDVAEWVGREHGQPLVDRKVVIVKALPLLALSVDDVREPELVPAARIARGAPDADVASVVAAVTTAMVRTEGGGGVPLVEPAAAVPVELRERLPGLLWAASESASPTPSVSSRPPPSAASPPSP